MVVAQRLLRQGGQAVGAPAALLQGLAPRAGQAQQHRHLGLLARRNGIRQAVQVEALLAERFTVIRDEEHGGVQIALRRAQALPGGGQQRVAVAQRVVEGVHHLGPLAAAQVIVPAGRFVGREVGRHPAVVGRPVVAQHVQHQQVCAALAAGALDGLGQSLEQRIVQAASALTAQGLGGQPVTHAFAAALVVDPLRLHTGARQHVQQGLLAADARLVVVAPPHWRKHAGQRGLGVGAAGLHPGPAQQVGFGVQQRGGVAQAAVLELAMAPVGGAHRLAHHQHQQARARGLRPARTGPGVLADRLALTRDRDTLVQQRARQRPQRRRRHDLVAQRLVVAHQRRQHLVLRQQQGDEGQQGRQPQHDAETARRPQANLCQQQPDRCRQAQAMQQQVAVEQLARLGPVGVQCVAQHRRVEHAAELLGEVAAHPGHQGQQGQQGLGPGAPDPGRQQQVVQQAQEDQQGQLGTEPGRSTLQRRLRARQERPVGQQGPINAQQCDQTGRRQGQAGQAGPLGAMRPGGQGNGTHGPALRPTPLKPT